MLTHPMRAWRTNRRWHYASVAKASDPLRPLGSRTHATSRDDASTDALDRRSVWNNGNAGPANPLCLPRAARRDTTEGRTPDPAQCRATRANAAALGSLAVNAYNARRRDRARTDRVGARIASAQARLVHFRCTSLRRQKEMCRQTMVTGSAGRCRVVSSGVVGACSMGDRACKRCDQKER